MNSVERVKKAIKFDNPDRVPMFFFNATRERSDLILVDIQNHFGGEAGDTSEWGFKWGRLDGTMGQPKEEILKDWADFENFKAPEVDEENRLKWIKAQLDAIPQGKYNIGNLQLSGFTIMSFLRGFSNLMMDFVIEPENTAKLADMVFGFETKLIGIAAKAGLHAVAFFDDWGTQRGMIISPDMWREFFRPRYKAQFDYAHSLGLDVYFHSCGNITPIVGDFLEIGVDMMNLSQPNLYDFDELGKKYGGRGCFVIPVSYQTTSISGTREDIYRDVKTAVDALGSQGGGLIGYVESYKSIGLSEENYNYCIEAFYDLGRYS